MFETIKLTWDGRTYTIPPDKVLEAIAIIEEVVTIDEIGRFMQRQGMPRAKLAKAFAGVMIFAGAEADPKALADELYFGMVKDNAKAGAIATATQTLLAMMMPVNAEGGKSNPIKRRKGASNS